MEGGITRADATHILLEVERFEHEPASGERVLLRLDGRYLGSPGRRILDATLFVDDGLAIHRHAPLPDADDGDGAWLWRAAFAVPASYLADARTTFALQAEAGIRITLPEPRAACLGSAPERTPRAARLARRYAAAVAVMVTVAVSPGSMPASARTEILRVRHADGSIVYLTRDGRAIAELPADAVIVDQPAGQAPPAPTPSQATQSPAQPRLPSPSPAQSAPPLAPTDHLVEQASGPGAAHAAAPPHPASHKQHRSTARGHTSRHPRHRHHSHAHQRKAPPPQQSSAPIPSAESLPPAYAAQPVPRPATDHSAPAPLPSGPELQANGSKPLEPLSSLHPASQPEPPARSAPVPPTGTAASGPEPLSAQSGQGAGPSQNPIAPAVAPPSPQAPPVQPVATGPGTIPTAPPRTAGSSAQRRSGDHRAAPKPQPKVRTKRVPRRRVPARAPVPSAAPVAPLSPLGATTSTASPLPLPGSAASIPNFVIDSFKIPPFLLPIYQAAGTQYGVRWEVLAAINEIETNYGRDLSVSSAGALGWMQFMPETWKTYGVDATGDGRRDPYNPVDAIFAAARYLKAAGGDKDIRQAVFAYNHATWYVDSVMLRARLISAYPPDLIGALTGLTQGRFPVAAAARYGNRYQATAKVGGAPGVEVYAHGGAPVVAVGDGVIRAIGRSKDRGSYVVLQDVYGNEYTYSHLGSLAKLYPVPKSAPPVKGSGSGSPGAQDPAPQAPATAGSQTATPTPAPAPAKKVVLARQKSSSIAGVKHRLFAHPERPSAQHAGGEAQVLDTQAQSAGFETYDGYFARPLGLNSHNASLRQLRKGATVIAGTVLGHVGPAKPGRPAFVQFEIRPAGKGAPEIDPKPILDGWKLLDSTKAHNRHGKDALAGSTGSLSIGESMLLSKPLLEKRVLSDSRIQIYAAGREDIRTGQIDRRVLEVLAYLAESGLKPTVSCLKSGHSELTASGNVSEHISGNAVDISAVNGISILGNQNAGGIAEQAVRKLMGLQGTVQPHQIISLFSLGQNTMALPDHANHIHVGFHPLFGDNAGLGAQAQTVLGPGQWSALAGRLAQIANPSVPTKPSKYALPDKSGH